MLFTFKCAILDDEDHAEAPFAYQINQGERPTFDSSNLSSSLFHLTMAKKLMTEKTKADIESHDAGNMVCSKMKNTYKM